MWFHLSLPSMTPDEMAEGVEHPSLVLKDQEDSDLTDSNLGRNNDLKIYICRFLIRCLALFG